MLPLQIERHWGAESLLLPENGRPQRGQAGARISHSANLG